MEMCKKSNTYLIAGEVERNEKWRMKEKQDSYCDE